MLKEATIIKKDQMVSTRKSQGTIDEYNQQKVHIEDLKVTFSFDDDDVY